MDKVILISIPERSLKNMVEQAVKQAINEIEIPKSETKSILNIVEGCNYLGISKSHCYKLTSTQRIPHSKRGKRIYFNKAELDNWLLSNKVKTLSDLDNESKQYLKAKDKTYISFK